jgi:DNA-directed RNA polymerase specialized sigma24 family protein
LDPKTFKLLQEADWGAIGKELLAFAEWRAGNYRWRHGGNLELAEGKTPEDVVQEVIVKTLSGDRRWDPDKGPLVPWLKDQVRSILDALAKSAAHRYEITIPDGEEEEGSSDRIEYRASKIDILATVGSSGPEELVLEMEAREHKEQEVGALFQAVSGESELEEVLEAIMDGCEPKPQALAAKLGVPVKEINNRVKRLRRRASKGITQ